MSKTDKKKLHMVQATYLNGKTAFLPYAVGTLIAYAFKDETVRNNYEVGEIVFLRENTDGVVARLDDPFYVGFSSYVWNFEYNKVLAKKIKEKYPDCIIQFGGHHVAPGGKLLEECEYVDYAMHNEGEESFRLLLKALVGDGNISEVPNISYRKNGVIVNNPCAVPEGEDFPSPYLEGVFDRLIAEHPELGFTPLIETNRGCPNRCAYCGWGLYKSKIRMFPMERVQQELKWVSDHKCEFFGFADANFGMFERDGDIVDMIIKLKEETGYPKKFQTSYAKNSTERIFEMTKKLNKSGLDKGVTLSFQSMSEEVLDNIHRSNIGIDFYKKLMRMYNEAEIPTYSELILGLPGETYDSVVDAVDTLLKAGQHTSLYIHMLEWLPCAALAEKEYMERFGMEYTVIPLNQPHKIKNDEDEIPEYSRIITKTSSMTTEDWIKMNLFACTVQGFHHLGLLEFISIYCYYELGVDYGEFYKKLINYLLENPDTVAGRALRKTANALRNIVENNGSAVMQDDMFGKVSWTLEEFMFLCTVSRKDEFYAETEPFLRSFGIPEDIFGDLIAYQKFIVKNINTPSGELIIGHSFHDYFRLALAGRPAALEKKRTVLSFSDPDTCTNWQDYAKYVVWYGRKGGKNLYSLVQKSN